MPMSYKTNNEKEHEYQRDEPLQDSLLLKHAIAVQSISDLDTELDSTVSSFDSMGVGGSSHPESKNKDSNIGKELRELGDFFQSPISLPEETAFTQTLAIESNTNNDSSNRDDVLLSVPEPLSGSSISKPMRKSSRSKSRSRSNSVLSSSILLQQQQQQQQQQEEEQSGHRDFSKSLTSSLTSADSLNKYKVGTSSYRRSSNDLAMTYPLNITNTKVGTAPLNSQSQNKADGQFDDEADTDDNLNFTKPVLNNIITSHQHLASLTNEKSHVDSGASKQKTHTSLKQGAVQQAASAAAHQAKQPAHAIRFSNTQHTTPLERARTNSASSSNSTVTTPNTLFTLSPNQSSRPGSNQSITGGISMVKPIYLQQQYVINEKQYLKKIQNTTSSQNDYYNRGVLENSNSSFDVSNFIKNSEMQNGSFFDENNVIHDGDVVSPITPTGNLGEATKSSDFLNQMVQPCNQNYENEPVVDESWAKEGQYTTASPMEEVSPFQNFAQEIGKPKNPLLSSVASMSPSKSLERAPTPVDVFKNHVLNKLKGKGIAEIDLEYLKDLKKYDAFYQNDYVHMNDLDIFNESDSKAETSQQKDSDEGTTSHASIVPLLTRNQSYVHDSLDISAKNADLEDCRIEERLEWQLMLTRVLKGDIVQNEKSKLSELKEQTSGHTGNFRNNIWVELKAWMNGHTVQEQLKSLDLLKNSVADNVFERVLNFKFSDCHSLEVSAEEMCSLIEEYSKVTYHWKTLKDMYAEKPVTATKEFQDTIGFLTSIENLREGLYSILSELCETTNLKSYLLKNDVFISPELVKKESLNYKINASYVDKIVKEEDVEDAFQKYIFYKHAPWIFKSKIFLTKYVDMFEKTNFPFQFHALKLLLLYPLKLIVEVINVRLQYSKSLVDPTMMIIDQVIDDLCSQIKLAAQIKHSLVTSHILDEDVEYLSELDEVLELAIQHVFEMINLKMVSKSTSIFKSSKDTDELLQHWDTFKNLGIFVNKKSGLRVASSYTQLFLQISMKLHIYILKRLTKLPKLQTEQDMEKWLIEALESIGSVKRKVERFFNNLSGGLLNQANFDIQDVDATLDKMEKSEHTLVYTGGELESYGIYVMASKELLSKGNFQKADLLKILNNSSICSDVVPSMDIKSSLCVYGDSEIYQRFLDNRESNLCWKTYFENDTRYHYISSDGILDSSSPAAVNPLDQKDSRSASKSPIKITVNGEDNGEDEESVQELSLIEKRLKKTGYLVLLRPDHPIVWKGAYHFFEESVSVKDLKIDLNNFMLNPSKFSLFTAGSAYCTDYQVDKFQNIMQDSVRLSSKICSVESIESVVKKISNVFYKMTTSLLDNYPKIVLKVDKKFPNSEILNNGFMFCRDFSRSYLVAHEHQLSEERKTNMVLKIMQLSIEWVGFICDRCNPTDLRTFRWCVPAMEYAMKLTSGYNVLALSADQYNNLRKKISACMSLLISHFDVMGGRARAMAANKYLAATQQKLAGNQIQLDDYDDDAVLAVNSQMRMESIKTLEKQYRKRTKHKKKIGKVLNDADREDKYLATLASSLSSVSIKWRKRHFVGGGSFGDVYSAINLDTGSILAVKQIRIQHSKNMEKIYPRIKDEMNVLEVLNHPNVVQYYGVEVHRDKVNIFMEYCEGGSLAALLEHGRFEDEIITQIYSLQMLEGLAYLHHSGVVHRDIKPENILLDHNGVVKYVDFGAAELISKTGTRKYGSTKSKNDKENSMMGTPMYMAPENITGKRKGNQLGTDDIWSLGCVILEMVTGRRPWANLDNEWAIMYNVAAGHIPQFPAAEEMTSIGIKFLSRLLKHNPDQRATAVELLLDPWIVEIRKIAFSTDDASTSSSSSSTANTPL